MKIIKKAFKVWHDGMLSHNPYEGYTMDSLPYVYADTPSKAKTMAREPYDYTIDGKEIVFTDLKVIRAKGADIVLFENEEKKMWQVKMILERRKKIEERTELVNRFKDGTCFYVQNGYVGNSVLFWAKNSNGYTTDIHKAETYTKKEILERFVNGRDEDIIWEANHVLENIKSHVDGQYLKRKYRC